jgi:hypothetical protein
MTFDEWKDSDREGKGSFAERNDSFIVEVAKVGWDAALRYSEPRIEWDEYAKSYCIVTKDGCYYWNP